MLQADASIASAIMRNVAALLCSIAVSSPCFAADETAKFPIRPIQLIVPYAAGGAVDQTARFLQQGMEKRLGQNVLIINRPGASTTIGTLQAARAAPDGHTIVMVSLPHVSNYTLLKEVPYAQRDLTPIATVTNQWSVLVVNPSLPLKTLADVIAYVKARPGAVNYGTFGIGTSAHLAALLFESMIGTKMQPVHYRGGAPTAVGVMTGEVQMAFGTALSAGGGIAGGQLRAIAVTSEKRLVLFPDVPTAREQGLDYVHGSWFGLLAPAGTPHAIVRRLYEVIKDTMAQPDVQKPIRDAGNEVWVTSPEEFSRFIAEETKLWSQVLKGLSIEQR
jgi:tripartite-type tricarboxylate transporter receptor subunit TctC